MKFIKKYGLYVLMGLMIGLPASAVIQTGGVQYWSGIALGKLWASSTAPTISSGFGTGAAITASNGTATFNINVGTGGTAASGVVALPTNSVGWNCTVSPLGAPQASAIMYAVASTASSITITNYTLSTGAPLAWTASTLVAVTCSGY